jgi:hypothetical protein
MSLRGTKIEVWCDQELVDQIDQYRRAQVGEIPSRTRATKELIQNGLIFVQLENDAEKREAA